MKLYLDNCCFNRPFDDQSNIRIRLAAEAKLRIQKDIRSGLYALVWSYIMDYDNGRNPFLERKEQIALWSEYSVNDVEEDNEVLRIARLLNDKGIKKIDSLHIACAIVAKADYFLTTDKGILKKAMLVNDITIIDPIGFIMETVQ
ncbi:PIN domain-containing protein [Desulfonatronum lacustre]|uniref:PIN domain-containing protein n=1 Tax=Desulfonatronum lacustre TaxID=66849 RepID=UPI00048EB446|nr:PIN domain-containing protein [Desulfonatronum lacustre]